MKTKNTYWIIAGILNLFTTFLHLIGGQVDLINPLLKSDIETQVQTEMLGVWHMVTIILFASSIIFLKRGFNKKEVYNVELIRFISFLYISFSFAFIFSSIILSTLAPQWILLFPIGVLGIIGLKKLKKNA
ncbi:hypothetical protein DS884_15480 [Tenacibaculum sp. E3R01]|uniref:hypothetical protein n=1 Tax=Tenacibaculum sp. E3R01 TaxID=2267227 RepID=UPI000DE8D593|nr:hypothetical protein [Tenacibaculum sp. E3R01]RBW55757.1 hypothetical protein DS884_15480 [Tenacibaculum sp. E3R01]